LASRRLLLLAAAVVLAACDPRPEPEPEAVAPGPAEPPVADQPAAAGPAVAPEARVEVAAVLTPDGYGPIRIGMTEAEARRALGPGVSSDAQGSIEPEACHHLFVGQGMANLVYMVRDGRVSRVTAHLDSKARTDRGLGIGDTEAEVKAAYGAKLEVEPHHYLGAPARYLTFWTVPGKRGVRYETDQQGIVREIHAGDDAIRYIEGCS
jgi:hypothetical protein